MPEIKIKYFDDEIKPIEKIPVGDWVDLRVAESVNLIGHPYKRVKLGIGMQLPKGYEAHIVPRSSTFEKWGIIQTNSIGVIDESYCGEDDEWQMPIYVMTRDLKKRIIPKGTRIAQFRIVKKQPSLTFKVVKKLGKESRGGFGTTGEK